MADIFHLDQEQRELVDLLENEDNLTLDEKQDLETRLAVIYEQKGNLLPQMFDIIEYLVMQNNHALEKREEIDKKIKKNKQTIERVLAVVKHIFVSTGQKAFQIGAATFKTKKLPPRLEITEPSLISDEYKTYSLTVPLHIAKVIAFEHPELNITVDDSRAETKKTELKNLWKQGLEMPGCQMVDDDFKVVVE